MTRMLAPVKCRRKRAGLLIVIQALDANPRVLVWLLTTTGETGHVPGIKNPLIIGDMRN